MSSINVNTIKSRLGGPPTLPSGVVVSAAATFSNDVSIGGTLSYEDVTNVDAVGLITARSGIKFGAAGIGGTIAANGNTTLAGVVTASQFVGDGSGLTNLVGTGVTNNVNTVNLNVISGISTFGGDVSIADKIIHTGDTNTAIRFPTADTITAETAGSEVIRITSDGDIGIDQSTPRSRLDVFESTTGDQTAIRVGNTNTPSSANDKRIEFVDGTGTTEGTNKFTYGYIQGLRAGGANSGDLIFGTKRSNGAAPVEAMRLDDSGYLGIGTAIPESELHVMESKSGGSSHASSQLTLERDGTNYLQFMTANNGTSGILFGDVADNDGTKIKYDHNLSMMLFETEAAERLRITTSGVKVTGGYTENIVAVSGTAVDCATAVSYTHLTLPTSDLV